MIATLLLAAGLQAAPASVAWYALPTARELHPVSYSYWGRFREIYALKTYGPGSSPLFKEPLATLDVHYRLLDATGAAPPLLDEGEEERWGELALVGASLAGEALFWETLARSEALDTTVRVARTFFSPNLRLRRSATGWQADVNSPDPRRASLERQELMEGLVRRSPRPPAFSIGSGLVLAGSDDLTDSERQVDAAAWLRLERLAVEQLHLRFLLLSRAWEFTLRERLRPGLMASAALISHQADPMPQQWGAGLTWNLPRLAFWSLACRFRRDVELRPDLQPDWHLDLALRFLPSTPAPADPGRWPLGQRIGAPGPLRPSISPGAPIHTALPVGFQQGQRLPDLPERDIGVVDDVGVGGLVSQPGQ